MAKRNILSLLFNCPLFLMQSPPPKSFKGCLFKTQPSLTFAHVFPLPPHRHVVTVAFSGWKKLQDYSVLCCSWLAASAGLCPLGSQTVGAEVIIFLPRGWLCEGASWEKQNLGENDCWIEKLLTVSGSDSVPHS